MEPRVIMTLGAADAMHSRRIQLATICVHFDGLDVHFPSKGSSREAFRVSIAIPSMTWVAPSGSWRLALVHIETGCSTEWNEAMRRLPDSRRHHAFPTTAGLELRNPFRPRRAVDLLGARQPRVGADVAVASASRRGMVPATVVSRLRHIPALCPPLVSTKVSSPSVNN